MGSHPLAVLPSQRPASADDADEVLIMQDRSSGGAFDSSMYPVSRVSGASHEP
jgi:hypothetical protein